MRRSAWVPLPTPGAPTRMMRAARLNSLVAIRTRSVGTRSGDVGRLLEGGGGLFSRVEELLAAAGEARSFWRLYTTASC